MSEFPWLFYQLYNPSNLLNQTMKGIPTQLQGTINFIDKILQNRALTQTFQCYLLNLEKAALDTLKLANIAFDNLDNHVPLDVRLLFQKTTNKIKEYIKNKPKGQLEKQEKYAQEFDEVQNYLENRPEIERSNEKERGELYKFLNLAEEKQKENRILLENIPKFAYGTSRKYSRDHRHFFSDIRSPMDIHSNLIRVNDTNMIQNKLRKEVNSRTQKRNENSFAAKPNCENVSIQTDLTNAELTQILKHHQELKSSRYRQQSTYNQQQHEHKVVAAAKKKTKLHKHNNQSARYKQGNNLNIGNAPQVRLSVYEQDAKKIVNIVNKQSFISQNLPTTQANQVNQASEENQTKLKNQLSNIQDLQLNKMEAKDKKLEANKGQAKVKTHEKKEVRVKKNETRRESTLKKNRILEQMQSSRPKKNSQPRQSVVDKPEKFDKINQRLGKSKNKQSHGNRSSNTFSNVTDSLAKTKGKQICTQTENTEVQPSAKKQAEIELQLLKEDEYQNIQSIKKKSSSLQRINILSELQGEKTKKTNQFSKRERALKNGLSDNESGEVSKTKNIIDVNEESEEYAKPKEYQDPINEHHEQADLSIFPYLGDKANKTSKYEPFTTNMSNFSLMSMRQSAQPKDLKKTKVNYSQFHQSMHSNFSHGMQEKYVNLSIHKKDNQKSLQILPAIRQDQENEHKNTEKVLSRGKEEHLQRENKRLLEQIQEGTTQKKGRTVEWIKVIRDIRQYQHLHLKYCGQNCVHLNKFYEFLKKKNLSMYINRKQLYVHKHNIEIKPNLL